MGTFASIVAHALLYTGKTNTFVITWRNMRQEFVDGVPVDDKVRRALSDSGVKGFKQNLYNDYGNEFVIFDPDIIKSYETLDIPKYAGGGLACMGVR